MGPTIDVVALTDQNRARRHAADCLAALDHLLVSGSWAKSDPPFSAEGMVGGKSVRVRSFSSVRGGVAGFYVAFDEEDIVELAREKHCGIASLLAPYVDALKRVDYTRSILVGFEVSVPATISGQSLVDSGAALSFVRAEDDATWEVSELRPMIGHYL